VTSFAAAAPLKSGYSPGTARATVRAVKPYVIRQGDYVLKVANAFDCYSGKSLLDPIVAALNADNPNATRYKVSVGGYVHKLHFVDRYDLASHLC
jgi:hypothetical protein